MIGLLLALATAAMSFSAPQAVASVSGATTVVIVRHAEAVPNAGRDPALSDPGQARAAALASALRDAGVAAVYATQYQRTQLTGTPLAAAFNLTVTVKPIEGEAPAYASGLAREILAAYKGRTIVIVGHSNTVPALVKAFSGVDAGDIAHDAYDNMFIVTASSPGVGSVVRARYGAR